MNTLVLGGSRFIGLRLVQLLHDAGHSVTVLNRGRTPHELPKDVKIIRADREIPSQVTSSLKDQTFDAVFDISSYVPETLQPSIEALNGKVGVYVFCSSTVVYQESQQYPIQPDFPLERSPEASAYQKGKVACEDLLREVHSKSGFPVVILRPPAVYGPYNHLPDREFSYFARALQRQTILIPGEPSALVQFAHVDDLANAFVAAAHAKSKAVGNAYTICGEYAITINHWIHSLGQVVDKPINVVYTPGDQFAELNKKLGFKDTDIWPFGWGRQFCFSIDKSKTELQWAPNFDIKSGLEMTYRWWCERNLDKILGDFSKDNRILAELGK